MPRVISVFLRNWPIDRLMRKLGAAAPRADAPLILVQRNGNRREVFAANGAAFARGLRVGLPVTMAQSLVPGLAVMRAEPAADADGLERLALWALWRYSPLVAADPPDGLVIDASGAAHLCGGEAPLLRDIVKRLGASGVTARAAISDSWGAAHGLARYAPNSCLVVPAGESGGAILPLPIEALRLPTDLVAELRGLGFDCIGDLASKPRAPLALRFGPQLHCRLDQALGCLPETFEPVRPLELIEVRRLFAEPISAPETLAYHTGKLVAALCEALAEKGLGARRLDLLFYRVDRHAEAIRVGTATPVRSVKHLTRLLRDKIETIDPGFGVETMTLCAALAEPFEGKQEQTSPIFDPLEADITSLIDVLANRVGQNRIYRLAPVESDVPERSVCRVAPLAPPCGKNWPKQWPRPVRLLPRPELVETIAMLPDHPPVSFTWRGTRRRVRCADGPERIFGEWWKRDAELRAVRDYFRVEDEGGERFWLFRAGDGTAATGSQRWFLHGIF